MGQFNFVLIAGLCSGLVACATAQENPNYQYSSKYQDIQSQTQVADQTWTNQSQAAVQTASQTMPVDQRVSRVYDGQAQGTILANSGTQSVPNQPYTEDVHYADSMQAAPYPATQEPVIEHRLVASPTDQAYAGQTVSGTPGHGAYIPESVNYDYSQNVVSANTSVATPPLYQRGEVAPDRAPALMVGNYVVQQGDTVYNLSRRLCVNLSDITAQNGLGQDYGINIGQSLRLPASRC